MFWKEIPLPKTIEPFCVASRTESRPANVRFPPGGPLVIPSTPIRTNLVTSISTANGGVIGRIKATGGVERFGRPEKPAGACAVRRGVPINLAIIRGSVGNDCRIGIDLSVGTKWIWIWRRNRGGRSNFTWHVWWYDRGRAWVLRRANVRS